MNEAEELRHGGGLLGITERDYARRVNTISYVLKVDKSEVQRSMD